VKSLTLPNVYDFNLFKLLIMLMRFLRLGVAVYTKTALEYIRNKLDASAKCNLVTGILQECLRGCGV